MKAWECWDDSGHRERYGATSADEAARAYVADCDVPDHGRTIWIDVWASPVGGDDDAIETVRVAIDPRAPDCTDRGGHVWRSPHGVVGGCEQAPGVWGSTGAGVRTTEVCRHCGTYRERDTGAHDHRGRRATATWYREPDDRSRDWIGLGQARETLGCDEQARAAMAVLEAWRDGRTDVENVPARARSVVHALEQAADWQARHDALASAIEDARREGGPAARVANYVAAEVFA